MPNQRLQLTYYFVKDELQGIPSCELAHHHSHVAGVRHTRPVGRICLLLAHPQGPPHSEESDLSVISDRSDTFWAPHDQAFRLPPKEGLGSAHDALRFDSAEPPADQAHDALLFRSLPPTSGHIAHERECSPVKYFFCCQLLTLVRCRPREIGALSSRARHALVTDPSRHPSTSPSLEASCCRNAACPLVTSPDATRVLRVSNHIAAKVQAPFHRPSCTELLPRSRARSTTSTELVRPPS